MEAETNLFIIILRQCVFLTLKIKRVIGADECGDSASRLTSGSGLRILLFDVTCELSISQSIVSK